MVYTSKAIERAPSCDEFEDSLEVTKIRDMSVFVLKESSQRSDIAV